MASLHRDPRVNHLSGIVLSLNRMVNAPSGLPRKKLRAEADEVCRGWQRAAELGRQGNLTEVQIRKVLGDIYERATGETIKFSCAADFLQEWVESHKLTKSANTVRIYRDAVDDFIVHAGKRSQLSIAGITPRDISGFRDNALKEGKANKTANLILGVLRSAFGTARKHGLILSNPAEAVDMLPEKSATRDSFTRDQITELLKVADLEWRGMVLIGACDGLRIGDAARLMQG